MTRLDRLSRAALGVVFALAMTWLALTHIRPDWTHVVSPNNMFGPIDWSEYRGWWTDPEGKLTLLMIALTALAVARPSRWLRLSALASSAVVTVSVLAFAVHWMFVGRTWQFRIPEPWVAVEAVIQFIPLFLPALLPWLLLGVPGLRAGERPLGQDWGRVSCAPLAVATSIGSFSALVHWNLLVGWHPLTILTSQTLGVLQLQVTALAIVSLALLAPSEANRDATVTSHPLHPEPRRSHVDLDARRVHVA